ncbi:MAG: type II toxin-antitoxin system RelE/ParE family toxin [Candidatus Brocadia sp.]|nr:type II toxin-antitoxin system RelE/ParE family toxin [Candidatus Brocadia sp.]UJS17491.1 MAG: type II toxin-antitoxin system RelE/ParE family toxin [Candidatus Jettenia sp.]
MAKIKWTLQALEDVEAVVNFIKRDSRYYARMFAIKVFEAVDRLELFPESGRVVPELNRKEIREVIIGNYRIIYRIRDELVEILTVYHSSRLFDVSKIKNLL